MDWAPVCDVASGMQKHRCSREAHQAEKPSLLGLILKGLRVTSTEGSGNWRDCSLASQDSRRTPNGRASPWRVLPGVLLVRELLVRAQFGESAIW